MAIVIMKERHDFLLGVTAFAPHSVFEGNMREAKAFCKDLNAKATLNKYYPVRVKHDKPWIQK